MKKESEPYLQKEKWETAYTLISRTINDNKIVGKPPIEKYFKRMKPEHKNRELDGTYKAFELISK